MKKEIEKLDSLCNLGYDAETIEEYILSLSIELFHDAMIVLDRHSRVDVKKRFVYI